MKTVTLTIVCLLILQSTVLAKNWSDYPPHIQAVVGEAENQGLEGMRAVAEAIRNRKTLKGVYGINSPRLPLVEPHIWKQAELAWRQSFYTNQVDGADHWESNHFKKPYWALSMIATATIGDHTFYKKATKQELEPEAEMTPNTTSR